jgi:hypothetical protein
VRERHAGRIFNIGTPANDFSIRGLANLMIEVLSGFPGYAGIARDATIVETTGSPTLTSLAGRALEPDSSGGINVRMINRKSPDLSYDFHP